MENLFNKSHMPTLILGNIIEWFDFSIYGIYASYLASAFFPTYERNAAILYSLLIFAFGFVFRPVGAIIFGLIGDMKGRYFAVNLSILCMSISTFVIGILPTYNQIGVYATILLITLRMCQGISTGGQFSGVLSILTEPKYKNHHHVGLFNALALVGILSASILGIIVHYFSEQLKFMAGFEWRIPYLFSFSFLIVYLSNLWGNRRIKESIINTEETSFGLARELLKSQPLELIYTTFFGIGIGGIYYVVFVYIVTYLAQHMHLGVKTSFIVTSIVLVYSVLIFVFSDKIVNKVVNKTRLSINILVLILLTSLASYVLKNNLFTAFSYILLITGYCVVVSSSNCIFAEVFKEQYRMIGCSVSYNFGVTISGFAPALAELSVSSMFNNIQTFITVMIIISLTSLSLITTTNGYKQFFIYNH